MGASKTIYLHLGTNKTAATKCALIGLDNRGFHLYGKILPAKKALRTLAEGTRSNTNYLEISVTENC